MSAHILDGKALATRIRRELASEVADLSARTGARPGLAAVLVGDDPASRVYVRNKRTACREAGMADFLHKLPADTPEDALFALISELNATREVHGILVQLPLPPHIAEQRVLDAIDPLKDVDGFHPLNVGLLASGRPRFVPCTPLGVSRLLADAGIETRGRRAVVVGRSNIVGRPMASLLAQKGRGGDATVTVVHTGTKEPAAITREAEILVVAAGRPEMVTAEWIRPGAVVVDVGIHRRADGSLCGDVHFESAREVAGWLSPVPGGVGPLTVAMLLHNTLLAAKLQLSV